MSLAVLSALSQSLLQQIAEFEALLPQIWSRESSGDPAGWTPDMPAYMQCHATTRLAKSLFGGVIMYQTLKPTLILPGEDLYWGHCVNKIKGRLYDFTVSQLACEPYTLVRQRVLSDGQLDQFDSGWPGMKEKIEALDLAYRKAIRIDLSA